MILSGVLNVMILKVCIFILYTKILFVTEKNYIVHSKSGNWTLVPNFIKEKPKK